MAVRGSPAELRLFGRPAVLVDEAWTALPPGKMSALLLYLAFHGGWVGRDELLYLFWPDLPDERAQNNLRPLIFRARRLPYALGVETERTRVRWPTVTDLQRFRGHVAEQAWLEAWSLVRGELLEGVVIPDAPELTTWLETERAELASVVRATGSRASEALRAAGDDVAAASIWSALHRADPLDEDVVRHLIEALARSGGDALGTFERHRRLLAEELGAEPDAATVALVDAIRSGSAPWSGEATRTEVAISGRPHRGLPIQPTPFVGRERELSILVDALADRDSRFVTIVGPGGVGKTRLAIEAAARAGNSFDEGAAFVDLSAATGTETIVAAACRALSIPSPDDDFVTRLVDHLAGRRLLLVLDNLEHLREAACSLIEPLMAAAGDLTLLATSRVRLGLPGESLFDLRGLSFPDETEDGAPIAGGALDAFEAVALLRRAALRIRPDLRSELDPEALARISSLVEGVPLALELASTWLRALTLDEIVAELERSHALVDGAATEPGSRHASMANVFDHSWSLLDDEERRALRALSVFEGGWTREAASEVADVTMPQLRSVIDASLVRRLPSGRFAWHPLTFQYARRRSEERPEERGVVIERHARYYLGLVAAREKATHALDGAARLAEVHADLPNVAAAWRWALAQGHEELLERADGGMFATCFGANRFGLFVELYRETVDRAEPDGLLQGIAMAQLGNVLSIGPGAYPWGRDRRTGLELVERGLGIIERRGSDHRIGWALRRVGAAHGASGRREEARSAWRRALEIHRRTDDLEGVSMMLNFIAQFEPDPYEAIAGLRAAVEVGLAAEDPHAVAMASACLGGWLAAYAGAVEEAVEVTTRACELHERTGLHYLGYRNLLELARQLGELGSTRRSRTVLEEARSLRARLGREALAYDLAQEQTVAAQVALAGGLLDEAEEACREVLKGIDLSDSPEAAMSDAMLAQISLERGDIAAAEERLAALRPRLAPVLTATGEDLALLEPAAVVTAVRTLTSTSRVRLTRGDVAGASHHAAEALSLALARRQRPMIAVALNAATEALRARGRDDIAGAAERAVADFPGTPASVRRLGAERAAGAAATTGTQIDALARRVLEALAAA